jgi:hypothetical protein
MVATTPRRWGFEPVLAKPTGRNSRYFICDNVLRSWLAAIADAELLRSGTADNL